MIQMILATKMNRLCVFTHADWRTFTMIWNRHSAIFVFFFSYSTGHEVVCRARACVFVSNGNQWIKSSGQKLNTIAIGINGNIYLPTKYVFIYFLMVSDIALISPLLGAMDSAAADVVILYGHCRDDIINLAHKYVCVCVCFSGLVKPAAAPSVYVENRLFYAESQWNSMDAKYDRLRIKWKGEKTANEKDQKQRRRQISDVNKLIERSGQTVGCWHSMMIFEMAVAVERWSWYFPRKVCVQRNVCSAKVVISKFKK